MSSAEALASLHRRVKGIRARVRIRSWEYRQRNLSRGVWFQFRRVLAEAASAHCISEEEARRLIDEGCEVASVGSQLEPPKTLVFVPKERLARIAGRSAVPLRLGPELLSARFLALVRFD